MAVLEEPEGYEKPAMPHMESPLLSGKNRSSSPFETVMRLDPLG
jgi:hypothetical protein